METNLTREPKVVEIGWKNFVYLASEGPFLEHAPRLWDEFWKKAPGVFDMSRMQHMLSMSLIDPSKEGDARYSYRAGITMNPAPENVPQDFVCMNILSRTYALFELRGHYRQLPKAYEEAMHQLEKGPFLILNECCVEEYVNNPAQTPEDDLLTHIYIPVQPK